MRSRIALLVTAVVALFLAAFAAAPARAGENHAPAAPGAVHAATAGNCGGYAWASDRVCLMAQGPGWVARTLLHVHTGTDGHDYADGEAFGPPGTTVYFDVSQNGGATWNGWVDQNTLNGYYWSSVYTNGTIYDGPNWWVRACATKHDGVYLCTNWN